jgi:hypothetical protein
MLSRQGREVLADLSDASLASPPRLNCQKFTASSLRIEPKNKVSRASDVFPLSLHIPPIYAVALPFSAKFDARPFASNQYFFHVSHCAFSYGYIALALYPVALSL